MDDAEQSPKQAKETTDDLILAAGGNGFSPAPAIRSDQVFVRGVPLPLRKNPRSPNL